ncbi:reverse transcriptase domain-containing protein [Botrimarina mediterranea]|nr:reverse transcriptase domain-containing protein [Botrimarina mediterranea]
MKPSEIRVEHLAEAMGLSINAFWFFARNIDNAYKPRRMRWDGKKHRPIDPLKPMAKKVLRRLHRFLQRNRLCHPAAHGGIKGRSCFTSARVHLGARNVWTRDAKDCYPSIAPEAMQKELQALSFRNDTSKALVLLFTYRGAVPQGSPISGDALNIFFWRLDQLLASMAGSLKLGYSRSADDFVFSGDDRDAGDQITACLENELLNRGMKINRKKKEESGHQTASDERLVHSIAVSRRRGTGVCRLHAREALELCRIFVAASRSVSANSIQSVASKRATIQGWLNYCRQADFGPAKTVRQQLEAGDRHVLRKLQSMDLSAKGNKWWYVNSTQGRDEPRRLSATWRAKQAKKSADLAGSNA